MRVLGLSKISIHFMLLFIFLLTFIIILITEVSYSAHKRNHLHNHYQDSNVLELYSFKKAAEKPVKDIPLDAVWQTVNGSRYKFYVYSAFLDQRSKVQWVVRLVAATRTKNAEKPICTFLYSTGFYTASGKIVTISENWGLPYSAVFIICILKDFVKTPISVSVFVYNDTQEKYLSASNHVLINNVNITDISNTENKDKVAVCVKPIHKFDKSVKLIEFIELNRILGVSHFTFYNASAGPGTSCVLQEYRYQGIASVYSWRLEIESKTEIRTEGMFAALNDCLYRYMYLYPYVVFIDIDEFIVPRFNITLIDLIRWLSTRYNTRNISSFSFQNAFFYLQWPDDEVFVAENEVERHLITLRKSRRKVKLNAHKQRSKFIVKPKNVVEVGNHFVWQFFDNHNTLNVPSNVAMLNHYRICEFGGNDCIRLSSTVDRTLYRYRELLTCKVAQRWRSSSKRCVLPSMGHFDYQNMCDET